MRCAEKEAREKGWYSTSNQRVERGGKLFLIGEDEVGNWLELWWNVWIWANKAGKAMRLADGGMLVEDVKPSQLLKITRVCFRHARLCYWCWQKQRLHNNSCCASIKPNNCNVRREEFPENCYKHRSPTDQFIMRFNFSPNSWDEDDDGDDDDDDVEFKNRTNF